MTDLKPGWPVLANDDARIGIIRDVGQHYLVVAGSGFSGDLYVPASSIANVEHETVHLNLARREVGAMGWGQPPRIDDDLETGPESDLHRHV